LLPLPRTMPIRAKLFVVIAEFSQQIRQGVGCCPFELVEKLPADTHEFAPFKHLLLGLLRIPAMFEQRETNPVSAFWCLRPCTQASVQSASSVLHSRAAASAAAPCLCAAFPDCTQILRRIIVLQPSAPPFMGICSTFIPLPQVKSPILVMLPTIARLPSCT
jgi:hypothetical protein